jgi:hypothetical protein
LYETTLYYYNDLEGFTKDQLMLDQEYGYFIIGERDKNGKLRTYQSETLANSWRVYGGFIGFGGFMAGS